MPFKVLTKQVGLYLDGDNVMENREERLISFHPSIGWCRLNDSVLRIPLEFELLGHSFGG